MANSSQSKQLVIEFMGQYPPGMMSTAREAFDGKGAPAPRAFNPTARLATPQPFQGTSTYNKDYPWRESGPRGAARSRGLDNGVLGGSGPFTGTSTSRDDFQAWKGGPQPLAKTRALPDFTPDTRNFATESRGAFMPRHADRAISFKPNQSLGWSQPFQGTTTQRDSFQPSNGRPARQIARDRSAPTGPDGRDFTSEMAAEYVPKKGETCPSWPVALSSKAKSGHVPVEPNPRTEFQTWRHADLSYVPGHAARASIGMSMSMGSGARASSAGAGHRQRQQQQQRPVAVAR